MIVCFLGFMWFSFGFFFLFSSLGNLLVFLRYSFMGFGDFGKNEDVRDKSETKFHITYCYVLMN